MALPPPQISYQFTQPVVPVQPNPLALEAVRKAENAVAAAQQDAAQETRLDEKIYKVKLKLTFYDSTRTNICLIKD